MDIKRAHDTSRGIVRGTVEEFIEYAVKTGRIRKMYDTEIFRDGLVRDFLKAHGVVEEETSED